jgi:spermidine synthase
MALSLAVAFESGVGVKRAQGWNYTDSKKPSRVLESYEGPDATVSAVEYEGGFRAIIVDGFITTQQSGGDLAKAPEHYMQMMGHLPMLLHPDPKNALVICFGTGQTANAVRKGGPDSLDIVDINPRVLKLAHNFSANEDVLSDPRVKVTIMDGRAYIRRTQKIYDVITLEPMPPNFAGVNALYSKEFYEFARAHLGTHGVIAQWVPFHITGAEYSASIAKTFLSIFPNAILWFDPRSNTGILLGSTDDGAQLGSQWPGFVRGAKGMDMSESDVRKAIVLNNENLKHYAEYGREITDDNQLLAYGRAVSEWHRAEVLDTENFDLIQRVLDENRNN